MRVFKQVYLLATVTFFSCLLGCTSTARHESTGQYIDNSALTAKIKASLLSEHLLSATEIRVKSYKGVVTLRGHVASQSEMNQAVNIVRHTNGVTAIKNEMTV